MNEQIKKLIDDAKLTAVSEMFEDELKKFAELIVKECAELVEYNSKWAGRDIREHFGVEE